MITPGSRYEQYERLFSQAHVYNEYGYPYLEGTAPNLKIKTVSRETTYGPLPPPVPARGQALLEYYVKGDEESAEGPQWLSYKFFGDAKRWTELADANPRYWYPLDLRMGDYIGVPIEQ